MITFRCESLGAEFAALRVEHERVYASGKIKAANRIFDESRQVAEKLMACREDRRAVLTALLDHENEAVVLGAAVYLLPIDEALAMAVLKKMDGHGVTPEHRISAYTCIREWDAGNMKDIRMLA
ncbi:MAG: DUF2019 domain-containing protein [Tabrizicola sp.]